MAAFILVTIYYHIACIHPVLSVSSVAGSDFYGWYTCHGSVGSMYIQV